MACIGIDCRFATTNAGLGTYTRNIVKALLPFLEMHHVVLFVRSDQEDWLSHVPNFVTLCVLDAPHYSLKEQILLPLRLRQLGIDLLYSPHFNVPLFCPCSFVCTVHDLTLHHFPNAAGLLKRIAYKIVMRHAIKRAKAVIAVSKYTKQDIAKHYGRQANHVTEGVDEEFATVSKTDREAILSDYGLMGDYFLYVGGSNQHKNIQMLITAHAESEVDVPLVLVSSGKQISDLTLHGGVTVLRNVPTYDLPAFYSGATAFVTASLYEGFCLPILEARACGTPILAANTTAIPEVAGKHALLVEPTVAAIAEALKSPPAQADAPEKTYNWQVVSQEIAAILTHSIDG